MDISESLSNKEPGTSSPDVEEMQKPQRSTNFRTQIIGYTFAFLVVLTYTIAVVSAQLAVNSTPRFQLSFMRYTTQALLCLLTVGLCREGIQIKKNKIWMIVIVAVFDFAYNFSFYHAAAYLPVGNMEGIFTALAILILGMYDLGRKMCGRIHVVSGVICVIGIILLVQPWKIIHEVNSVHEQVIPCEEIDMGHDSFPRNTSELSLQATEAMLGVNMNRSVNDMYGNLTTSQLPEAFQTDYNLDAWIGYILITAAAISMSIIAVFIGKLTKDHHPAVVSFWLSLGNCLVSLILMISLEKPSLPAGSYCKLFTFLLTTLAAMNALFSHITLKYLLPSETAMVLSMSMVVLVIVQHTLLVHIKPGRQNVEEICGAVVTLAGAISSPVFTLYSRYCKSLCSKVYVVNE